MKNKFILFIGALLAFSITGIAQSVKITPKKVIYKRPKTVESEYKREISITYPLVSGANGKKIEAILNYEKAFDFKLKDQQSGGETWLDSCDFNVNYNNNNILDVELYMEGSGAYPSITNKYLVVNTKTGTRIKPSDVFVRSAELAAMVKKSQIAEMKKAEIELGNDPDSADFDSNEYFNRADFKTEHLWSFTVADKGITFHYDYGFPHIALALQPDGDYFFSWKVLKPYIKPGSVFSRFVK